MVARPIAETAASSREASWIDGDPAPFSLRLSFRPVLELFSRLGYTERDVDKWLLAFNDANRGLVGKLELNAEGELLVSPMLREEGSGDEAEVLTDLNIWTRGYGGEAHGSRLGIRLPGGQRYAPDAAWISPEQQANRPPPLDDDWLLPFCPIFVVEILARNDSLAAAQRKMADYISNGARLGWLIDRGRRQAHIYRPGVAVELLDNPDTMNGEPELPGFVFEIRRRIFEKNAVPR